MKIEAEREKVNQRCKGKEGGNQTHIRNWPLTGRNFILWDNRRKIYRHARRVESVMEKWESPLLTASVFLVEYKTRSSIKERREWRWEIWGKRKDEAVMVGSKLLTHELSVHNGWPWTDDVAKIPTCLILPNFWLLAGSQDSKRRQIVPFINIV